MNASSGDTASKLRFELRTALGLRDLVKFVGQYQPSGRYVLNTTEWRGKPARSCCVMRLHTSDAKPGSEVTVFIEVEYRPDDWISYVGDTKYHGWTPLMVKQASDGKLLDEDGSPLPVDAEPVMEPVEIYHDIDFNQLEFGELIEEQPLEEESVDSEELMSKLKSGGRVRMGLASRFTALHRSRRDAKIMIIDGVTHVDNRFGSAIVAVDVNTPQLKQVVAERLYEIVRGFVEGRLNLSTIETDEFFMVDLSSVLVDATGSESRFDCLEDFLPPRCIFDLALRLSARYELKATPVTGEHMGLLLEHDTPDDD